MLELRQLRYFSRVVELKSFSAAASQLRIAQPALSRCVKQLEDTLGVELLARHGRGVTPTAAGDKLYHHAQRLIREMRLAQDDVAAASGTPSGHLYLAMPPATGQILAPPVVERYRKLYPRVSLHILEGFSGYIHEWLNTGRIDVAVLHNPSPIRNLSIRPLLTEQMFVIAPGDKAPNKLATAESYRVRDLSRLPLVLPSRPHSLRMLIELAVAKVGHTLEPTLEADGLPIIKAMVERGLGFTTLTQAAVTREVANGTLRAIPIRSPAIRWDLDIACRRDRQPSEAAVEEVHSLVRARIWTGSPHLLD